VIKLIVSKWIGDCVSVIVSEWMGDWVSEWIVS
jgi:hypothetical protein